VTEFDEIYNNYFKDVYRFISALSRDSDIAEEITQETFFKALKSIDSFDGKCDIRVWLCQIAKNTYYSLCKKQNKAVDYEEIKDTVADENLIDNKLIDKEQVIEIHKALHMLDEPYKEVFTLRVFGELSFLQIANLFGKTESWARVTYHRAKIKIIEQLKEDNS
jgi:RNA polymerase sigma-70 factor (ECF subfamily)